MIAMNRSYDLLQLSIEFQKFLFGTKKHGEALLQAVKCDLSGILFHASC